MTQFISLCSVLSIVIYSISVALCFMMYGKTGKNLFQYAGAAMFVAVLGAVGSTVQNLLGLRQSPHMLIFATMLVFVIVESYLLAKVIHAIFRKTISTAFYIWLCLIIIINGLVSPFPVDLALWCFLAFNVSIIILVILWRSTHN